MSDATTARAPSRPLRLVDRVARIGVDPSDPPDVRLRKGTLTLTAISITVLATIWVLMYLALGRPIAAAVPLAYQVASLASLAWFARTHRYDAFRITQVVLMLCLPVLLMWSLGGFVNGSVVMIWAFAAPVGALVFGGPRSATLAFLGFLGLTVLSGLLDPMLAAGADPFPDAVRTTMFVLDIAGVASVTFLVLVYFVRERQAAQDALDLAHRALQQEQARSEGLLDSMLPRSVARRLKEEPETRIADGYEWATVLFVDLVDSTPLATRLTPAQLVDVLHRVFTALDDLAAQHGLTKIKTGGDSWMAVSGVPEARDDHAEAAAEVALKAGDAVSAAAAEVGQRLRIRIGMHSGPVVAGVIGTRTPAFDLWGETVAIASRMESHGLPGRIQVSLSTAQCLMTRYRLRMRGTLDIKGVGEMTAYLLEGRKP